MVRVVQSCVLGLCQKVRRFFETIGCDSEEKYSKTIGRRTENYTNMLVRERGRYYSASIFCAVGAKKLHSCRSATTILLPAGRILGDFGPENTKVLIKSCAQRASARPQTTQNRMRSSPRGRTTWEEHLFRLLGPRKKNISRLLGPLEKTTKKL